MQQGKTLTLDSGSAKRMQPFPSSSRRTGDMEVPNKTPYMGQGNRQPLHSNNSSDQESNQHRIWTSCEEDRPNNWVGNEFMHSISHSLTDTHFHSPSHDL